jgi:hypothetical protein
VADINVFTDPEGILSLGVTVFHKIKNVLSHIIVRPEPESIKARYGSANVPKSLFSYISLVGITFSKDYVQQNVDL